MSKKLITGLIAMMLVLSVQAQDTDRQWVTDKLRLSLYQRADSQSQIIKYLSSGDLLEVEQISGAYAFVTTPDGSKGWVKRGFLVKEPTSNLLLEEEVERSRALEEEIERLGNSKIVIEQYEKDMDALVAKIEALEQKNEISATSIAQLNDEIELRDRAEQESALKTGQLPMELIETAIAHWKYVAAAAAILALLVALITKQIVENRIRNRFHGIKIW